MQPKYHIVTIKDLMPQGHFLRKLQAVLDLSFVYEETAHLCSRKYGRRPIGPVVIVKYLLVGFLYGIPLEQLAEMEEEAGNYWEQLDIYEEEGVEELARRTGKRRGKRTEQIKKDKRRGHKRVSRTDSEFGHLNRPGKPGGPHDLSHQTLGRDHGIITGLTVTPGDVYDSAPYLEQLAYIHKTAGRQKAPGRLRQALCPTPLVQVLGAGVSRGAEAAADLVRRCHNLTCVLRRGLEAAEDHCLFPVIV